VGMPIPVKGFSSLPTYIPELELFPHIQDVAITNKIKIIKQKSKK
jgi:hypothetical protein